MAVVLIVAAARPARAGRSNRTRTPEPFEAPIRPASVPSGDLRGRVRRDAYLALPSWRTRPALCARARNRRGHRRFIRDQPAFHHGPGRHAFLWPCRLFRIRRLWRGAVGEMACRVDGSGARRRAFRGAARRAVVRLVLGATLRCLSRHADFGFRPDRMVDRVPMAGSYGRIERRARHLAECSVRSASDIFPACAHAGRRRHFAAAPRPVRAVRLRHACGPRLRRCAPKPSAST